jgi:hypothetical protein
MIWGGGSYVPLPRVPAIAGSRDIFVLPLIPRDENKK